MTARHTARPLLRGHRTAVVVVLCLFGLCAAWSVRPEGKPKDGLSAKTAGKPKNGRGAKAKRGGKAKAQDERVYLVHSDRLYYDRYKNPDAQILCGNVAFRHKGASLYCDSAHFYEASNSFEAFGNVKMYQGDTLSLFSDYAFYDGNEQMAMARYNVVLKHNKNTTLYTDSLNFDRIYNIGYFFEGGKLVDKKSVLSSDWGEYNTETRVALFNYNVRLRDDDFFLKGDTLYYDTGTSVAHVLGPSDITSGKSHIYTEDGYYNTDKDQSSMFGRSVMDNGGRTMTGDSVYYDSRTGVSEAFGNVVYTDTVNRNRLLSDYYWYNEKTGYGMATKRAVAVDFSQRDSLYMHADTFKIYTYNINTDSVYRMVHAYNKVRAYRTDVQAVCDSLVYSSKDSCLTMHRDPIVWNNGQQLLGEVINVYMKDSTINRAHVVGQALSVELLYDSVHYNQISSTEMMAHFSNGEIYLAEAIDNVLAIYFNIDDADSSFIMQNYCETSRLKMFLENRKMKSIWMPKVDGMGFPMSQIPPDKRFLPAFAWFDYVRPLNKEDIFNWRGKKAGTELKEVKRREAPLQHLDKKAEPATSELSEHSESSESSEISENSEHSDNSEKSAPSAP